MRLVVCITFVAFIYVNMIDFVHTLEEECTPERCENCPVYRCITGSILVPNAGLCGCCPGCVLPSKFKY